MLSVDRWALIAGSVSCLSVFAAEIDPETGVYKSQKPKALNKTFKDDKKSSAPLLKSADRLLKLVKEFKLSSVLNSMFETVGKLVNITSPIFVGKYQNTSEISEPPAVDTDAGKKYIYPGEAFWKKEGYTELTHIGKTKSIRDERATGVKVSGASGIKLNKRED
jgi:hypothetical protein